MMTLRIIMAVCYLLVVLALCIYTFWSMPVRKDAPLKWKLWRWTVIVGLSLTVALTLTGLVNAITAFAIITPL